MVVSDINYICAWCKLWTVEYCPHGRIHSLHLGLYRCSKTQATVCGAGCKHEITRTWWQQQHKKLWTKGTSGPCECQHGSALVHCACQEESPTSGTQTTTRYGAGFTCRGWEPSCSTPFAYFLCLLLTRFPSLPLQVTLILYHFFIRAWLGVLNVSSVLINHHSNEESISQLVTFMSAQGVDECMINVHYYYYVRFWCRKKK